jgi:hypothetical protein
MKPEQLATKSWNAATEVRLLRGHCGRQGGDDSSLPRPVSFQSPTIAALSRSFWLYGPGGPPGLGSYVAHPSVKRYGADLGSAPLSRRS